MAESYILTSITDYTPDGHPMPTLESIQQQLVQWSEVKRVFRRETYGTTETIHDALDKHFTQGSGKIEAHLRLLREQYQQTKSTLDQIATVLATIDDTNNTKQQVQQLHDATKAKAEHFQIMSYALNETLVSSQLAQKICNDYHVNKYRKQLKDHIEENIKLTKQLATAHEDHIEEIKGLTTQLATVHEDHIEEIKGLKNQLATVQDKCSLFKANVHTLNNRVRKFEEQLALNTNPVSLSAEEQKVSCCLVGIGEAHLENQEPNLKRQRPSLSTSSAGSDALPATVKVVDELKIYD